MITRDYYRTLGLSADASAEDIKKAYRNLALKYHPDRNPQDREGEERLKEINEAYQILGDEEKRRRYDIQYRQPFENYMFHEGSVDNDFVTVLRKFSQRGFDTKRAGGCRRKGLGKRGCRRWMRDL